MSPHLQELELHRIMDLCWLFNYENRPTFKQLEKDIRALMEEKFLKYTHWLFEIIELAEAQVMVLQKQRNTIISLTEDTTVL